MDGWMDERTNERADGWTEEHFQGTYFDFMTVRAEDGSPFMLGDYSPGIDYICRKSSL